METEAALEAGPIVTDTLDALIAWAPTRGRNGADLRSRVNQIRADVLSLLQNDAIGPALTECFDLAVDCGINIQQIDRVRQITTTHSAALVGAQVVKHACIQLALMAQANIIAGMTFVSRTDVERVRNIVNAGFESVAEDLADAMDQMTYRAIVGLHASISFFLVETARPLPQMLRYRFGQPMTTLTIAYRLYADAGRADEVLEENHIVHPAFARMTGRALSE